MMHEETKDLLTEAYAVLGLSEGASATEVRTAHEEALRSATQDGHGWERTKEIGRAFEMIKERLSDGSDVAGPGCRTQDPATTSCGTGRFGRVTALLFPPPSTVDSASYWARVGFFLVITVWGARFIFAPVKGDYTGSSFMHLINLPFHEAGHLIFAFLGDFLRVLGGTLGQVIIPIVCMVAFLRKAEPFSASCCLWCTGQSLIDVAPYVYDARAGELMLLGGVTGQDAPDYHDWHNMLGRLGLLSYDHAIAYASKWVGAFLVILSLSWGAWALFRQYECLRRDRSSGEIERFDKPM